MDERLPLVARRRTHGGTLQGVRDLPRKIVLENDDWFLQQFSVVIDMREPFIAVLGQVPKGVARVHNIISEMLSNFWAFRHRG